MDDWYKFDINDKIISNLERLNYSSPTEIQDKVLVYNTAMVDLIIQARTGEGKTLCYGIPIVNFILNNYDRNSSEEGGPESIAPVALIIVPTRELGVQVNNHIKEIIRNLTSQSENEESSNKTYYNIKIANILGGFAKPKQLKQLNKYQPEILIATPGRLWEIIENEEAEIMNKISRLKFLILDEADRMMEVGHFRELKMILDYVYLKIRKGENEEALENTENISDFKNKNNHKNKIMDRITKLSGNDHLFDKAPNYNNTNDEEDEILKEVLKKHGIKGELEIEEIDPMDLYDHMNEDIILDTENGSTKLSKKAKNKLQVNIKKKDQFVELRTILCSATIESLHFAKGVSKKHKKYEKNSAQKESEKKQNLEKLVRSVKFFNKLIFVKLAPDEGETDTSSNMNKEGNDYESKKEKTLPILPKRLVLESYKCDPLTKDLYLYHILNTSPNESIIVFTNSISHTKKLGNIFSFFDFKISVLHSKMQQSQRLKNLDRFKEICKNKSLKNSSNVLICTDVAARGLDIPKVDTVIHYHLSNKTETFVHRSGRTARANEGGRSVSLVSQKEFVLFRKIMNDLKISEMTLNSLNISQLEKYKSLFEYTKDVEKENHTIDKENREMQWLQKTSQDCEIELDPYQQQEFDEERINSDQLLNKKRKKATRSNIQQKKIYQGLLHQNIPKTSFLTPDLVAKLNKLMKNDQYRDINLSESLRNASVDSKQIKERVKKKNYIHRRKKRKTNK